VVNYLQLATLLGSGLVAFGRVLALLVTLDPLVRLVPMVLMEPMESTAKQTLIHSY
jgi:hypothetical protein